nr:unnamed protein product [Digitaria exilis]
MSSISRLMRAAREGTRVVLGSSRIARRGAEGRGRASFFTGACAPFRGGGAPFGTDVPFGPIGPDGLPTFVNWSTYGAVTPIQDQGDCGSCWAFGVAALIEADHFIKNKELIKLSEQHLIDANNLRNFGCKGGSTSEALEYITRNGGIVNAESYPYKGAQGPVQSITAPGVQIADYFCTFNGSEFMLKWSVAKGPILVTIGADDFFMMNQYGRVLDGPAYTLDEMENLRIAHSLLVIGYGETQLGQKIWLVKNSHGGERFLLLARDNGKIGGAFGLTRRITRVQVSERVDVTVKSDEEMRVTPRTDWWSI